MSWPAQSPDLNPIENLRHYLDLQVRERNMKPSTLDEFCQALEDESKLIDTEVLKKLVYSMPMCYKAVVDVKEYSTKF